VLDSRNIHVARTIEEVRRFRSNLGLSKLGFVPTMGALHEGHISLVLKAKKQSDVVASSIFVNPTQFSAGEDLDKYPRSFDSDLESLKAAGVDFVFAPKLEEVYGRKPLCHVEPADFSQISEGIARPDFFRGVATIVCKLFNIVTPSTAYFGQKDISQCILVKQMVEDLNMPVDIVICETLRHDDGLAMSSRNTYLSPTERAVANVLYRALSAARTKFNGPTSGGVTREELLDSVMKILESESMVSRIEYVSIASHFDMKELNVTDPIKGAVISSAIRLGSVRLIDNVLIGSAEKDIFGNDD
jgi:pantoate--beta-alanine ligase